MNGIAQLHTSAMELADRAFVLRQQGDATAALSFSRQAFQKEAEAALLVVSQDGLEPTRSILQRSAATLALECGELREAERFISIGLSGNPPDEIAEELRDLWEEVTFARHLQVHGVELEQDEFQLSIHGNAVGHGIASSDEFVERVKDTETLIYRTAERTLKRAFREHGRRKLALKGEIELYMSVPRAASFAVSFKIGYPQQLKLPHLDLATPVIDEFLECMDLYTSDKTALKQRITDEAYYRNFVALADAIAPDGDRVKIVGFTASRGKAEKRVVLKQMKPPTEEKRPVSAARVTAPIQVRGKLRFADAIHAQRIIQLLDKDGKKHTIDVPTGLMDDIVKPMWGTEVVVTGRLVKGKIRLERIKRTRR